MSLRLRHRIGSLLWRMWSHTPSTPRAQVDFYDRSVLGEGIHCLKCGSFVNLPRDGDPMVRVLRENYCGDSHAIEQFLNRSNVRIAHIDGASAASARGPWAGIKFHCVIDSTRAHWLISTQVAPEYQVFRAGRCRGGRVEGAAWRAAMSWVF